MRLSQNYQKLIICACHPELSEGSFRRYYKLLHWVQDDIDTGSGFHRNDNVSYKARFL